MERGQENGTAWKKPARRQIEISWAVYRFMEGETTSFDSYLAFDSYLSGEKHPYNFVLLNGEGDYSNFAMPGNEAEFLREAYDENGTVLDRDFYPLVHKLGEYADEVRFELEDSIGDGVQHMPEGEVVYRRNGEEYRWNARMDKGLVAAVLGGGEFETVEENTSALEAIQDDFEEVERYPPQARRVLPFDASLFQRADEEVDAGQYENLGFEELDGEMTDSIRGTDFREGLHPSSPMIVHLDGYGREFVPGVLGSETAEKFFRRQTGYGSDVILEDGLESGKTNDLTSWVSRILDSEGVETRLHADISEIAEGDISNPADPARSQEIKGFATTAYLYFEDEDEFVEVPNGVFVDRFTEDLEFEGKVLDSPELPEFEQEEEEERIPGFQ